MQLRAALIVNYIRPRVRRLSKSNNGVTPSMRRATKAATISLPKEKDCLNSESKMKKLTILLLALSSLTALAQRPLGTFTIGAVTTTNCPANSVCRDFSVSLPNYPYGPASGRISVKTPRPPIVAVDVFLSGSGGRGVVGSQS
jgi:hypothetical protein